MKHFTAVMILIAISPIILIQSCSRTGSDETFSAYAQALSCYMEGHNEEALQLLEKLCRDSPYNTEASLLYGRVLFYSEKYTDAATCLERALANSINLDSSKILARCYLTLNRIGPAETLLDQAMRYSSEDPELLYLKARCRIELNDPENALALLIAACTYMERQIEIPLELASLYGRYGLVSEAIELVEQYENLLKDDHPLKPSLRNLKSAYQDNEKTRP